jgi:hypothetical protein
MINRRVGAKFVSLKLAFIALLLVVGGLLLRMVMMLSNDN